MIDSKIHGQTAFHCRLPCFADNVLQIEGLWQPCIKQVYQCHFPNSMWSLHVSVSRFGNFHNISTFFIITISAMVICDQ